MIKILLIAVSLLSLFINPSSATLKEAKYLELQCFYRLKVKKEGYSEFYIMKVETGWVMYAKLLSKPLILPSMTFIPDTNHEIKWDID